MITSLLKHPCSPSPPQLVLWLKAQEKAGEAANSGQSAIVGFSGEDEMLLWLDVLSIKVGKEGRRPRRGVRAGAGGGDDGPQPTAALLTPSPPRHNPLPILVLTSGTQVLTKYAFSFGVLVLFAPEGLPKGSFAASASLLPRSSSG